MPERVLDCGSVEKTYHSLEIIFGVPRSRLQEFLQEDFDEKAFGPDFVSALLDAATERFDCPRTFDLTVWFHLTRVPPETDFRSGLLPLHEAKDSIWNLLGSLATAKGVSPQEWQHFRTNNMTGGHHADLYYSRLENEQGPFALLVREVAFFSEANGNVDYLQGSETVVDICETFKEKFNIDLFQVFLGATRPCIVSFKVPRSAEHNLAIALSYLYSRERDTTNRLPHNCFDGNGVGIPYNQIVGVEFDPMP